MMYGRVCMSWRARHAQTARERDAGAPRPSERRQHEIRKGCRERGRVSTRDDAARVRPGRESRPVRPRRDRDAALGHRRGQTRDGGGARRGHERAPKSSELRRGARKAAATRGEGVRLGRLRRDGGGGGGRREGRLVGARIGPLLVFFLVLLLRLIVVVVVVVVIPLLGLLGPVLVLVLVGVLVVTLLLLLVAPVPVIFVVIILIVFLLLLGLLLLLGGVVLVRVVVEALRLARLLLGLAFVVRVLVVGVLFRRLFRLAPVVILRLIRVIATPPAAVAVVVRIIVPAG
mmetsp:Transcript_17405/g.37609  ORF Transcript_17405/g.37609 Transcript_17405/m.37609 type:complete len:288 (-) Transcript_17405:46-909(-)